MLAIGRSIAGREGKAQRLLAYRAAARAVNRARGAAVAFAAAVAVLAPPAAAEPFAIVALGDSLIAGYGLTPELAFPARLEAALAAAGIEARVVNAGIPGDTSAGGRARLRWSLAEPADLVIVELGANDALRGIDPESTYANLDAILIAVAKTGARVLLTGMLAPPNLGREYGDAFESVYTRLAAEHDVVFYPFFLDGVAAQPEFLQRDGAHPNVRGVEVLVARILPSVLEALGVTAEGG